MPLNSNDKLSSTMETTNNGVIGALALQTFQSSGMENGKAADLLKAAGQDYDSGKKFSLDGIRYRVWYKMKDNKKKYIIARERELNNVRKIK